MQTKKLKSVFFFNSGVAKIVSQLMKSKKVNIFHEHVGYHSLHSVNQIAEKFNFKKDVAIIFKIGQVTKLSDILN